MKHVKIKCDSIQEYNKIKLALDLFAVDYVQKQTDKPIHINASYKKEDIDKILMGKFGISSYKSVIVVPNFDKVMTLRLEDILKA